MLRLFYVAMIFLMSSHLSAQSPEILQREFIAEMHQQHGFSSVALQQLLQQAKINQPILDAIARPAEKRLDWGQYRKLFVTPKNVADGVSYWRTHQKTLAKASATYGVPAEILLAIIGIETRYGRNTGRFPVLDALFTLGFHYPPRASFFRSELGHFLQLTREEKIDPKTLKGSYAGAMGIPQFISSSYRRFAVDFDGDGQRDIWNNHADAIGSVGNYFAQHHWTKGGPVMQQVEGVNQAHAAIIDAGYKPQYSIADLRQSGIKINAQLPDDALAGLLEMRTDGEVEHWITLDNFYVITRYNRSPLYATAVYQLSKAIHAKYHE